jgi:mono/diheme cytochrome c family protein
MPLVLLAANSAAPQRRLVSRPTPQLWQLLKALGGSMNRFFELLTELYKVAIPLMRRFFDSLRTDWRKHVIFLFLFLAVTMIVTTVISRMYQFWDVGSNSWFDRLKGEGWEFQRGAATVEQDQFGDQFSTVKYLKQGWAPADSMWFYTTTQGSDLLPYDFFMVLEKPGTSELFRSNQNLNYYRYLPQKVTLSNPDALPVGLVKDTYKGNDFVGFTCAACHTAQLNYKGTGIRIDGGPAGADLDSFLQALATAVWAARSNADIRARFVKKVMGRGHYDSEDDVVKDLQKYAQRLSMYNIVNHSETPYGYSRLDAFGRIYNRVLEHIITQEELKEQLNAAVGELVKEGTLTQAEVDSITQQQRGGSVLSDTHRDHLVLRLSQVLPLKAQLRLGQRIFNRPDAPVSYPFLWDIPQHDYVQWNGLATNAGLGPIGRNAGEVIGTFGTLDWTEVPGISLYSFISGQGLHATHISFNSSVNVHNLRLIENRLMSLQSPQWPKDIFPPIDQDRSARGERLFTTYCEACHTRIKRDDPKRRIVAHISRLSDIGTDPKMAENAAKYFGLSGILRNQYVNAGPGNVLINERAPVAALLTKATLSVVATPENKNVLRRVYQWVYDLAAELFSNQIKASLKQGNYDPDTTAEPYSSMYSYKARSLNGIWATAPYLHNGSVPTLYDLLLPKKRDGDPKNGIYRPDQFQVGSREFDPEKVGFKSSGYNGPTFDTRRRGNSNAGHPYGTQLDKEQRLDLLEYLKSL